MIHSNPVSWATDQSHNIQDTYSADGLGVQYGYLLESDTDKLTDIIISS
jgi:hypothetical protein